MEDTKWFSAEENLLRNINHLVYISLATVQEFSEKLFVQKYGANGKDGKSHSDSDRRRTSNLLNGSKKITINDLYAISQMYVTTTHNLITLSTKEIEDQYFAIHDGAKERFEEFKSNKKDKRRR